MLARVIITGAFLAEHAEVVDGKLNVRGGVISRCGVGDDRMAELVVVVLTQAESGGTDRGIVVDILPPAHISDEPLRVGGIEIPEEAARAEIGFALYLFRMPMRFNGRWRIIVAAAGGSASLPIDVSGPNGG